MSTTTPTGWHWRDPSINYRGLIFTETEGHAYTNVFAMTDHKEGYLIRCYPLPSSEVRYRWERVINLIDDAQKKQLRAWDGIPWDIHKIRDSDAWWQAIEAWRAAQ